MGWAQNAQTLLPSIQSHLRLVMERGKGTEAIQVKLPTRLLQSYHVQIGGTTNEHILQLFCQSCDLPLAEVRVQKAQSRCHSACCRVRVCVDGSVPGLPFVHVMSERCEI